MGRARRWASVALSGLVATSLFMMAPAPVKAAEEVLDWRIGGSIDAGGIYSTGERSSSKFNEYRDMDNGFVGELELNGEHKEQPYYFNLYGKNPARDDQEYSGAFGRYGLFQLDLSWDRTPHVLSNSAQTIFQQNGTVFTLPATDRPFTTGNAKDRINSLTRSVDLSFTTDVGTAAFKFTPTDALRFDVEYSNRHRDGYRPLGTVIGNPGGSVTELAVPIDTMTHEVKFGAQFSKPAYALAFNYTGSIFQNDFQSYTWDNPTVAAGTANARGQVSAAPDSIAHTFNFTGTYALPLNSRISGNFAYSMLRQDQTFLFNSLSTGIAQRNTDDAGNSSPDAKSNIVTGNILLTSRPISNVTASARYRYFEYQNDMPEHVFSFADPEGAGSAETHSTLQERFTKQNAGGDIGWHPISMLNLKAGFDYEHWNRGDRETYSTNEYTPKFSADVTPVDWFLGRVTYSHGERSVKDYHYPEDSSQLPQLIKFDEADRRRDKVDVLLQLSPWETVTPSLSFAYARDDYTKSSYGLTSDDYWSGGFNLGWSPLNWLQFSADYTYEQYNYNQQSRYRPVVGVVVTPDTPNNDWTSKSKDEFHNLGANATVTLIPKKLFFDLGYIVTFGYTTIKNANVVNPPATPSTSAPGVPPNNATAVPWDKVFNVLQTVKVMARYNFTEKFQARLGFAYERYNERDFARDPLQPFMGGVDTSSAGITSVFLGAAQPNYEAYITSFLLRYAF